MKIIFTITSIGRGGSERQLSILASNLNSTKYQSKIIFFNSKEYSYLQEYNLDNNLIKIQSKDSFKRLIEFHNVLKVNKPEVVFTWGILDSLFTLLLLPLHRFVFINGSIRHGVRLLKFDHYLRSVIAWLSPYVVANSKSGLRANNLKQGRKNFILHNGIEKKFEGRLQGKALLEARNKLFNNLSKETIIFISTANLIPYKDYFTVLECLCEIKNLYDFRYLIIGDGHSKPYVEQKITSLCLQDKVLLLGKVEQVEIYLKIADYFIHSSKFEGLSNSILEAMFTGLPIIATKVGGTPELVYEKSFRLFNYKDGAALKSVLSNIKNEFKEFDPYSQEYQNHLAKYSSETMLKDFEKILENVLTDEHK